MLEPDRALRIEKAHGCQRRADRGRRRVRPPRPRDRRSSPAGGLGTWDITGANPRITEIHAGSYIFTDAFHRKLVPGFDIALTVLATIISRTGDMVVLDSAAKPIGIDRSRPRWSATRARSAIEHGEHFIHEEHIALELSPGSPLAVGDRVELMPGYSPDDREFLRLATTWSTTTASCDVWPILARYGSATAGIGPVPE